MINPHLLHNCLREIFLSPESKLSKIRKINGASSLDIIKRVLGIVKI
jgi:hypothetical protein